MSQQVGKISTFVLVLFITGSIDSIRNLPATALFGSSLIFFFILAAIMFLIPTALVSAELSSSWTEESGIFHWVRHAFGDRTGFFAIWLQWINTMVWYPTILSFIAGTIAYLIDPQLANNKIYLISVILSTFWTLTLLNLRGIETSANFAGVCAMIGMIIPMTLIISCAVYWVASGQPLQLNLSLHNIMPNFEKPNSWISLTAIITSFLGIELTSVHVKNIDNPKRTFPRAMFYSAVIILSTMIFGSLSIAFVIPNQQISLVDGIMQAFHHFFHAYRLDWILPIITIMLIIGSVGGMINWIVSPARGLLQSARHGFLPHFLTHTNRHGVANRLLILQAMLVSGSCAAFLFMPSVNGSYWLLSDLSTELYVLMYVIMFVTAIYTRYKYPDHLPPFKIGRNKIALWCVCSLGIVGCLVALVVGFFPPANIDVGGIGHYIGVFSIGLLILLLPAVPIILAQRKS